MKLVRMQPHCFFYIPFSLPVFHHPLTFFYLFSSFMFYLIYIFVHLIDPASRIFLHLISRTKVRMGKAHPVSTPTKMEAGPTVKVQF